MHEETPSYNPITEPKQYQKLNMEVYAPPDALDFSWQGAFPESVPCAYCNTNARLAFVAIERGLAPHICNLRPNELMRDGPFWPHDCIAVAVYLCEKGCAEPATAKFNQA